MSAPKLRILLRETPRPAFLWLGQIIIFKSLIFFLTIWATIWAIFSAVLASLTGKIITDSSPL